MGNTRLKAGEQQKPCVVWLDKAHCFGTAFIFHTTIPPETKVSLKLCIREQQPLLCSTEKPLPGD